MATRWEWKLAGLTAGQPTVQMPENFRCGRNRRGQGYDFSLSKENSGRNSIKRKGKVFDKGAKKKDDVRRIHREKMTIHGPRREAWNRPFPHSLQKELTLLTILDS